MLQLLAVVKTWIVKRSLYDVTTLLLLLLPSTALASLAPTHATYRNPVIAQTTPDPAIIKALDGYYYEVASADKWQDGSFHLLPIYRSSDLVHWTFVRDAFPSLPAWAAPGALWAPDIRYFNHKYYLYYTVPWTNPLPKYGTNGGSAIGVAIADSPAGPWSDAGDSAGGNYAHGPIIPPRACVFNTDPNCYYWTFDPAEFTDQDGQMYMYYGSYFGGTVVQKLTADGLHTQGPAIQVGHWDRYEGTYIIRHDVHGQPYYYNFSSTANCCAGPNTAYSVVVNRAQSPIGPFVDQNGFPMERPAPQPVPTQRPSDDPAGDNVGAQGGGYPTLKQNGNQWHGVGHNAIITDLSGQDWIVYHGVDEHNGWVNSADPNDRITYRQMLLDRLDWTSDGWPVVNAGAGPSLVHAAPVTTPIFGDNFNASQGCAAAGTNTEVSAQWRTISGTWNVDPGTCTTGGFLHQATQTGQGLIVSKQMIEPDSRIELDVQLQTAASNGLYGAVLAYQDSATAGSDNAHLAAFIDPAHHTLVTAAYQHGQVVGEEQSTPLPANFDPTDWYHLSIDEDINHAGRPDYRFTLSDSNQSVLAVQKRSFPSHARWERGSVGFITDNAQANFDNVTVAPLKDKEVAPPSTPPVGSLLTTYSDEFNGSLGPQWSWLREDPTKHGFVNGQLSITANNDLYRNSNNATNLLLEAPPTADYAIETKITFDPNQNYQQAGLLIYSDDDHYIKFGPFHGDSLNKVLSGHESLEPLPPAATACDVQPAAGSNVAIKAYTRDQCPNEGESWDYLTNPHLVPNGSTANAPTVTNWLRIYRHGNVYTPYVSLDGSHWVRGAAWTLDAAAPNFPVKIGLFAFSAGPFNDVPAYFDYFHVYNQP